MTIQNNVLKAVYQSGLKGVIVFICLIKNAVFISNIVNYNNGCYSLVASAIATRLVLAGVS